MELKIKDILKSGERTNLRVYVVEQENKQTVNTIIECDFDVEYNVYDDGFKKISGTLHPARIFKTGSNFQVIRVSNNKCNTSGISPEDFEHMLNSDYIHVIGFNIFSTKEAAEKYVKDLVSLRIQELEAEIKQLKHIEYISFI